STEDSVDNSSMALSYSAYRLYYAGLIGRVFALTLRFSVIGWFAASYLELSPAWVAALPMASSIPTILLSLPSGVIADRYDTQKILLWTAGLTAIISWVLWLAVITNQAGVTELLIWAVLAGVFAAVASPAQNAILPRLIDMRAMTSAVALTSMVWNSMRVAGPAIGAVVITVFGFGAGFILMPIGFTVSAILLILLKPKPEGERADSGLSVFKFLDQMVEGLSFIVRNRLFFNVIGLTFSFSLFGMSYVILLPSFANDILGASTLQFGLLEAAAGAGAVLGTLAIMRLDAQSKGSWLMLISAVIFGISIGLFAFCRLISLSMLILFVAGFSSSIFLNIGMITMQLNVPDQMRGRVMGIWSLTWFLPPVGGFLTASMAEFVGLGTALTIAASTVSVFAILIWLLSPELRQQKVKEVS
ncbi:MAG: MFS transporter, partial [Chloroflexota bacterium]|nr:MFS transporter [Chloroflexota bacterium]